MKKILLIGFLVLLIIMVGCKKAPIEKEVSLEKTPIEKEVSLEKTPEEEVMEQSKILGTTCYDSDGKDISIKGVVKIYKQGIMVQDTWDSCDYYQPGCEEKGCVDEVFCGRLDADNPSGEYLPCPNSCEDGACI